MNEFHVCECPNKGLSVTFCMLPSICPMAGLHAYRRYAMGQSLKATNYADNAAQTFLMYTTVHQVEHAWRYNRYLRYRQT